MLVAEITQRVDLNPTARRLAVRVVLGFLPELLAAIVLALVGILTREVAGLNQGQRHAQGQAA